MPQSQMRGVVRFGLFELEPQTGILRKHGLRIRLQEQPFQVLLALLEKPGKPVTRDELRQKLWPGAAFGDFDHSLNIAVNKIREALGDSAETPRFVETLPRRGYRFIAEVQGLPIAAPADPPSTTAPGGATAGLRTSAALNTASQGPSWRGSCSAAQLTNPIPLDAGEFLRFFGRFGMADRRRNSIGFPR